MLKSEAERVVRRVLEDNPGPQYTDEEITALALIVTKICERMIEEALASWRPSGGGQRG